MHVLHAAWHGGSTVQTQHNLILKAAQWQISTCIETKHMPMRLNAAVIGLLQQPVLVGSQMAQMNTHTASTGATRNALLCVVNAHASVAEGRLKTGRRVQARQHAGII